MRSFDLISRCGLRALLLLLSLLLACSFARAQDDEIDAGFRKVPPEETLRLRELLAQPVPPAGEPEERMRAHFRAKATAAERLGDALEREAVLRAWRDALPDAAPRNDLANLLIARGDYAQGNAMRAESLGHVASAQARIFYQARAARDLYDQRRDDDALAYIDTADTDAIEAEKSAATLAQRLDVSRGRASLLLTRAMIATRRAQYEPGLALVDQALAQGRRSQQLAREVSARSRALVNQSQADIMKQRITLLRLLGRFGQAEQALAALLRLAREVELPPGYQSGNYMAASQVRFAQREFAQAEALARKSDALVEQLGYAPLFPTRVAKAQMIIAAQIGQQRYSEAAALFEQLDALAGADARMRERVALRYERGLVYLNTGRAQQAAPMFAAIAQGNRRVYGPDHFYVAQSEGLQGAALWRAAPSGDSGAAQRSEALALLKKSVRDYMSGANADYLESNGFRLDVRERVFATWLEALAATPGEDTAAALGPADWVRGGVVQEALADAAVRAAAGDPALAGLVRREQDAKNELLALRRFLAGEAGDSAASPLPEIAAKMRDRVAQLERTRRELQAQLKARFPDYERLVRPLPATPAELAGNLGPDEALVVLLPTETALYAWAMGARGPALFARRTVTRAQLAQLVTRVRAQLDFAAMPGGRPGAFDNAAAYALYRELLEPLQGTLAGKKQIVIAAGGVLSQLPFGVLQTQASTASGAGAPWLIRQAALTQVPSVSAWVAVKLFSRAQRAPEALAGWGDPLFRREVPAQPVQTAGASATRQLAFVRGVAAPDPDRTDAAPALRYGDIPPLPETRDELLAIAGVLKADARRDLRLGELATRDSVLAASRSGALARKRVLLFATHGLMAGDLPDLTQPALALAATGLEGSNTLAPLLTLEDVLALKLNADWVVLSACNTAAGDGRAEEALSGLARGFFYAGSRSLLVTHWAVESESAKLLTTGTFDNYTQNPGAAKAESLRQAMLKVMAMPQYAHPSFWAPYALVGDGAR